MNDDQEPRQADGSEEAASVESGEPTNLGDLRAAAEGVVPDLDERENRISMERRAAGPPLLPATPLEELRMGDGDRQVAEEESTPTDPD